MAEDFNKKLGLKLKEIRESLGYTLEEVARKIGFNNYQTLSSIEDGSRSTKSSELAIIAKIYHKSVNSLLKLDHNEIKLSVLWRDRSDNPKIKIKEEEFLKYCRNYNFLEKKLNLERKCNIQSLDLVADDFDWNKVIEIATEFSRKFQLGVRPACSLRKILEEKCNVKILYLNLENYGSGVSAVGDFGSAILVNSLEPVWRRDYDLAHELFHLLTWDIFRHEDIHANTGEKSYVEKLADYFAACLLLPSDEVTSEFRKKLEGNKISVLEIVGIAREFGVSTPALLWRLVGLKELHKKPVFNLLNSEEFRKLDSAERKGLNKEAPFISESYVKLAFKAYTKSLISKGKLAEFLGVSVGMVDTKLAEFGYSEGKVNYEELAVA